MLDFGFVFCRVLKYYGLSYGEMMTLPMKTFWLMSDCVNRLSATADMRQLSILTSAQGDSESINSTMQRLSEEVGIVSMAKPVRDESGLNELKLM